MTAPSAEGWLDRPFAHRGLHGPADPENSLAAVRRAVEQGLGVEVDVRLSADGVPVIHHDRSLERMCGVARLVADLSAAQLTRLRLGDTEETLPTLAHVLHAVGGAVPLLVDVKTGLLPGERRGLVDALNIMLRVYRGPVSVESFDPFLLSALAERTPMLRRGQIAGVELAGDRWWHRAAREAGDSLWPLRISRPQFMSFNVDRLPSAAVARARDDMPVLAWTVRSANGYDRACRWADGVIVEGPAVDLAVTDQRLAA